ncbi:hypothetical protein V490_04616 [Pseudogymnoascus sp. VKM F-3557]|nr:hypothetical protein V490_04616 [Pseudogymnoascus sp. VKM F-3557]
MGCSAVGFSGFAWGKPWEDEEHCPATPPYRPSPISDKPTRATKLTPTDQPLVTRPYMCILHRPHWHLHTLRPPTVQMGTLPHHAPDDLNFHPNHTARPRLSTSPSLPPPAAPRPVLRPRGLEIHHPASAATG